MGYGYPGDNADANGAAQETPCTSPKLGPQDGTSLNTPTADVLWEFDEDEMIRLCRIYEEEVGIMYPVLRIDTVIAHVKVLASWMEAAKKSGLANRSGGQDSGINDHNTLLLKIVLCGGLLVEGHGSSVQAQRIFAGISNIANKMLMSDLPNVQTLPFLALVVRLHFLCHDSLLSVTIQLCKVLYSSLTDCIRLGTTSFRPTRSYVGALWARLCDFASN
jgi:hypothetical protein